MDWTGSASKRKPQGVCLPPTKEPLPDEFKYTIPAGTLAEIRKVTKEKWFHYVTTKDCGFQKYQSKYAGRFMFKLDGWMIRVRWKQMIVKK